MCGRFTMLTYDEVLDVVHSIEFGTPFNSGAEWPLQTVDAFPSSTVPLIVPGKDNQLEATKLSWGYPVSWQKNVVFNARIESALSDDSMWAESIQRRRCIVPTRGFYEPHRSETFYNSQTGRTAKQQYRFTALGSPLLLLAGIFEGNHFSIVTTEPNENVSPVHDRMPLVLSGQEAWRWLGSDYAQLATRAEMPLSVERVPHNPIQDDSNDQLSLF